MTWAKVSSFVDIAYFAASATVLTRGRVTALVTAGWTRAGLLSNTGLEKKTVIIISSYLCRSYLCSRLVRSSADRTFLVRALSEDIVFCSWARQFTLLMPASLSTQVYKSIQANSKLGWPFNGLAFHPGGVELLLVFLSFGISSGLLGQLARMQTLILPFLPLEQCVQVRVSS